MGRGRRRQGSVRRAVMMRHRLGINLDHADITGINRHLFLRRRKGQGDYRLLVGVHPLVQHRKMEITGLLRVRGKDSRQQVVDVAPVADFKRCYASNCNGLRNGRGRKIAHPLALGAINQKIVVLA